jgi:hypothetical protein
MTTPPDLNVSPLKCRWVVPGSEHHEGCWSYAMCVRVRAVERLVNEADCARCPRWEGPDDPDGPSH